MRHFHSLLTAVTAVCGIVSATPLLENRGESASSITKSNPFSGHQFFISPGYRSETQAAATEIANSGNSTLAKRALYLSKNVSTFLWLADNAGPTTNLNGWLTEAARVQKQTGKKQVVQLEVYNLPDRDCSANASSGELSYADGGEEKYKAWIQSIVKELKKFPQLRIVIGLETDSIGNLVTNLSVPKCGNSADAQKRSLSYAIAALQLPNVSIYVDGAHAGWVGWPGNIEIAADIIAGLVAGAKAINPKAGIRGVATNIRHVTVPFDLGFNGLGNQPQEGYDELVYVRNLAPLLAAKGVDVHFIVDQGRSGNQNYPRIGLDWCNNKNAAIGPRPTTQTPDPLIDAIVWVKEPGQSDGTSDPNAARYDPVCGSDDTAFKPAPEAGSWFQAYFVHLLANANPPVPTK
ncbi:putative cellulose 1,4-beta-cellobiosidase II precursor [Serendipita vermifera]|nr:putative cellulose 1,4-beta-cellobiosidase II precursor [Serendipita vermifera]